MRSAWDEVTPNAIYRVFKSLPLSKEGNDGLIYLYQPIIGPTALALYFQLIGDEGDQRELEFIHLDCLNALNIGLPTFLEARKRLEGMGLLSVFQKEDQEFGKIFIYQLEEPLAPQAFMKDVTYSFLLNQAVGDRKFQQLTNRFEPKKIDYTSYREVTANFTEVYGQLNMESFALASDKLEHVSKSYQTEGNKRLEVNQSLIDWDYLLALAKKKYIIEQNFTQEFKEQLSIYASLYGYQELELVDLLAEVVAIDTGEVEPKALQKLVLERNKRSFKPLPEPKQEENAQRFNLLRQTGYSERDIELIQTSEQTAPFDFLESIKIGKNSFVADSEMWVVRSLVERSPLPNPVINILIHYVLVIQNHSTLQASFVNAIAANWSEKGVKAPETAIKYAREYVKEAKDKQEAREKRQTTRPGSYPKKNVRVEKLPEWATETKSEKEVVAEDPKVQEAINQRLQAYLKRKEGES